VGQGDLDDATPHDPDAPSFHGRQSTAHRWRRRRNRSVEMEGISSYK
jgi:hypothetical protein